MNNLYPTIENIFQSVFYLYIPAGESSFSA